MVGSIDGEIMNVFPLCTWEPLGVLSTAGSTRTSLGTTRRTNRTFFHNDASLFAGHENVIFFLHGYHMRGGVGATERGKKNWPPSYSTNGMPAEWGPRANRITMWKEKKIKSNQHVADHYLSLLPSAAAFAPGWRSSPRPHTWLPVTPCWDLWPHSLGLWPNSLFYHLEISDVRMKPPTSRPPTPPNFVSERVLSPLDR